MGTLGEARGIGRAVRKDVVRAAAELDVGVCVPVPGRVERGVVSSDDGSGVVGREALKLGRRREVRDGDGGRGVGGRL